MHQIYKVPKFQSLSTNVPKPDHNTSVHRSWGVSLWVAVFCGVPCQEAGREVFGDGVEDFIDGIGRDGGITRKSGCCCCCPVGGLNMVQSSLGCTRQLNTLLALVNWVIIPPKLESSAPWTPAWAPAWPPAWPPRLSNRDKFQLRSARLVEERVDPAATV